MHKLLSRAIFDNVDNDRLHRLWGGKVQLKHGSHGLRVVRSGVLFKCDGTDFFGNLHELPIRQLRHRWQRSVHTLCRGALHLVFGLSRLRVVRRGAVLRFE